MTVIGCFKVALGSWGDPGIQAWNLCLTFPKTAQSEYFMYLYYEVCSPRLWQSKVAGSLHSPETPQDTVPIAPGPGTSVDSMSRSLSPISHPDMASHLHVEDCLLVPILPTVPDCQGVIAPLQIELFKGQFNHLEEGAQY